MEEGEAVVDKNESDAFVKGVTVMTCLTFIFSVLLVIVGVIVAAHFIAKWW